MPEDKEFQLETRLTSARGFLPYVAAAGAIVGIVIIILTMTTGLGARLLPMDASYDAFIAPTAADGSEALALNTLAQEVQGKSVSIRGSVTNRTDYTIPGLQAVVDVRDSYTLPMQNIAVDVAPPDLPAGNMATFEATLALDKEIGSYSIRFRLPNDGPFVPHRDERPDAPMTETKPPEP